MMELADHAQVVMGADIMKLSKYVFKTNGGLFNLVTATFLPIDSSVELLRANFFLEGQEKDAILATVDNKKVESIGLKITPTWRCTLRCKHCFVLGKLVKKDDSEFSIAGFRKFLQSMVDNTPDLKSVTLGLVGGEISLDSEKSCMIFDTAIRVLDQSGISLYSTATTNGTVMNEWFVSLAGRLNSIVISVDGDSITHNEQRKAASLELVGVDLYRHTLRNIKRLVVLGFRSKIIVQAAVNFDDRVILRRFISDLVNSGVDPENIKIGTITPTDHNPDITDVYLNYIKGNIYRQPCCKWRVGRNFVIDNSNTVYVDYFRDAIESQVGTLDDSFSDIIARHREYVMRTFPGLVDPKCMACPVLGACWGRCPTSIRSLSEICDPDALLDTVTNLANSDKLVSRYPYSNYNLMDVEK